jgi:hypothetical protein
MAKNDNEVKRLLEMTKLPTGMEYYQPLANAWDAGGYNRIEFLVNLVTECTSGTLKIQTAAYLDEAAFVDTACTLNIGTGQGSKMYQLSLSNFLRFVRVHVTSPSGANPVLSVDGVAKN